jgi:hypothetical protein
VSRDRIGLIALNLFVPGGGLIVAGRLGWGAFIGLLFLLSANAWIYAALIAPDDFSALARAVLLLSAAGAYAAAQVGLIQAIRDLRNDRAVHARRGVIASAERWLAGNGDGTPSAEDLTHLAALARDDLLAAYRHAQILGKLCDPATADAWRHVARLDKHQIYRAQVERALAGPPGGG